MLRDEPTNRVAAERLLSAMTQRSFLVPVLPAFANDTFLARCSPDGRRIVTAAGGKDGSKDGYFVRAFDRSGKPVAELPQGAAAIRSLDVNPDGTMIATAADDRVRVWSVALMAALLDRTSSNGLVREVKFLPPGKLLVVASNTVAVWQMDGSVLREFRVPASGTSMEGARGIVLQTAVNSTASLIAFADDYSTLRICRLETLELLHEKRSAHAKIIRALRFNHDGSNLLSAGADAVARVWDAQNGVVTNVLVHNGGVSSAEFGPDGTLLVTASSQPMALLLYELSTDGYSSKNLGQQNSVNTARFSPDGHYVVAASDDGTARVWEVAPVEPACEPTRFTQPVLEAEFTPDGEAVLVVIARQGARLLARTAKAQPQKTTARPVSAPATVTESERKIFARGHTDAIDFLDVSPDGKWVVTASADRTARLWERQTQKRIGQALRHDSAVNCARFSPDGQRVVTSTISRMIRVWDARTTTPLTDEFSLSDDPVSGVWFAADGSAIITDRGLLFPIQTVQGAVPLLLPALAEAVAGLRNEDGISEPVPANRFLELKAQLEAEPAVGPVSVWMKAFVSFSSRRDARQ
jgi:WD40 repeat protein